MQEFTQLGLLVASLALFKVGHSCWLTQGRGPGVYRGEREKGRDGGYHHYENGVAVSLEECCEER